MYPIVRAKGNWIPKIIQVSLQQHSSFQNIKLICRNDTIILPTIAQNILVIL